MGYMKDRIGDAAMYEQLAEEASELCKAALKMARILRGENPTPVTGRQAWEDLEEEYTDVMICTQELNINYDAAVAKRKRDRFKKRWRDVNGGED